MRHKHADLIIAWANGAEIQFCANGTWLDFIAENHTWHPEVQYRIKPEPKPDVDTYCNIYKGRIKGFFVAAHDSLAESLRLGTTVKARIKLTFDGETGKLKSAEVLE